METYIITYDRNRSFVTNTITKEDLLLVEDGKITVIRCSDTMELLKSGEWQILPTWRDEFDFYVA